MSSFSRMRAGERQPVLARHHDVEHDQVDLAGLHRAPRRRGVLGDARAEPVLHEIAGEQVADVAMVVDDEDVRRGLHERELTRSPRGTAKEKCNGLYRSAGAAKTATKPVFPTKFLRHPP